MQHPARISHDADAALRYLFVVARKSPDILARVQDRLYGDPRIEVLADRRYGERRRQTAPRTPERRGGDRRRPTNVWNDLTIYPTLVAQRHVDSYAQLEQKLTSAAREAHLIAADNARLREEVTALEDRIEALVAGEGRLRTDNARLQEEIGELQRRLGALAAAEAEFKADVGAALAQAEETLATLIAKFRRFTPPGRQPQTEPRLRSL